MTVSGRKIGIIGASIGMGDTTHDGPDHQEIWDTLQGADRFSILRRLVKVDGYSVGQWWRVSMG